MIVSPSGLTALTGESKRITHRNVLPPCCGNPPDPIHWVERARTEGWVMGRMGEVECLPISNRNAVPPPSPSTLTNLDISQYFYGIGGFRNFINN